MSLRMTLGNLIETPPRGLPTPAQPSARSELAVSERQSFFQRQVPNRFTNVLHSAHSERSPGEGARQNWPPEASDRAGEVASGRGDLVSPPRALLRPLLQVG